MRPHPRPSLDRLEELLLAHHGECTPRPCDGCDLAAEVLALHRLRAMVIEALERLDRGPIT